MYKNITISDIQREIVGHLRGDAIALWQGTGRQEREEYAVEVQRGNATPEQVADTFWSWAEEEKSSVAVE